jgi:hypothetical protein
VAVRVADRKSIFYMPPARSGYFSCIGPCILDAVASVWVDFYHAAFVSKSRLDQENEQLRMGAVQRDLENCYRKLSQREVELQEKISDLGETVGFFFKLMARRPRDRLCVQFVSIKTFMKWKPGLNDIQSVIIIFITLKLNLKKQSAKSSKMAHFVFKCNKEYYLSKKTEDDNE